ncbi:MAG: hypothetical protein ABIK96_02560 [bacterium]
MGTRIMNRDFDDILRAAAPQVPDPGPTRRTHRAMLKPSLRRMERLRRLSDRSVAAGVCILALCFLVGTAGDLGGDDFEVSFDKTGVQTGYSIYREGMRGTPLVVRDGWTIEDAREIQTQHTLNEGVLEAIDGWSIGGLTLWSMGYRTEVNGKSLIRADSPRDPVSRPSRLHLDFLTKEAPRFREAARSIPGPVPRREVIAIDGRSYLFEVFTMVYPEYGPVTWYIWEADR